MVELHAGRAIDEQRPPRRVAQRVGGERVGLDHQPVERPVQGPFPRRSGGTLDLADHAEGAGVGSGAKNGSDT